MTDDQQSADDSPDPLAVVRPRRDRRADRHGIRLLAVAGAALLVVLAVMLWSPWRSTAARSSKVGSVTTTAVPTTVVAPEDPVVAPLTGMTVAADQAVGLLRPALVAKIDGAVEAMPQAGLEQADMVIEVRVEGISRYLAVWHSEQAESIGPIRSARTTDPDLLAMFGRPLFAYSGGNRRVLADLRSSDWFEDVSHDAVPGRYERDRSRRAPHNLMADAPGLVLEADEAPVLPGPVFRYRSEADPPPGEPIAGMAVSVGSDARFEWDPELAGWRRWAHSREHVSPAGEQLAPENVVVIEVDYVRSVADRASPEAVSVGSGRAWVYSDGRVQAGRWDRPDRTVGWQLSGDGGAALTLTPGATWVVLTDGPPLDVAP
jgi:hypothetical protein